MRSLVFEGDTWTVYGALRTQGTRLHKTLRAILKEMLRGDPSTGIGKPEALRHKLSGFWSRRLSQRHRVLYKFDDKYIYIFAIGGHYDQYRRSYFQSGFRFPAFPQAGPGVEQHTQTCYEEHMLSPKPTACSLLLCLLLVSFAAEGTAVEVAPRISDREIIEALAELKAGQQANQQQIADLKQSTQQQIADLKQSTQQQIADLRQDMNQRFNDLRQDMNQRFDALMTLLQILIGTLVVVLGAMLAWLMAIWRRLVRVEERQTAFETQDDEIKFLKDNYGHLHELFVEVVKRTP